MSRRPDPARLYEAHRAGTIARLRDKQHITEAAAEQLVQRWEAEAPTRGLEPYQGGYWYQAERWFDEQPR